MRPTRHPSSRLLRFLGVGLCCFALLLALGGSSTCVWKSGSGHHDDDDEFDDDSNLVASGGEDGQGTGAVTGGLTGSLKPSPDVISNGLANLADGVLVDSMVSGNDLVLPDLGTGTVRLTQFAVDFEPRTGHHPIARFRDIRGLSVFSLEQLGMVGAEQFSHFSTLVIQANQDLLGLPPEAGHLRVRSVHFLDEIIAVVHEQVPGRAGDDRGLDLDLDPDGEMIFVFDLLGRLLQIENQTTLPPGVVVAVPEDLLPPL